MGVLGRKLKNQSKAFSIHLLQILFGIWLGWSIKGFFTAFYGHPVTFAQLIKLLSAETGGLVALAGIVATLIFNAYKIFSKKRETD